MRHRKNNVGLNRTAAHRKALLANLTIALVTHKKIVTTLPKARAARRFAEKMITFARRGDVAARRQVYRRINDRDVIKELFQEIGPKFRDRNGGYTRIIKLDPREGDNAPMAVLELVGFAGDEPAKKGKKRAAKKTAPKKTETKAAKTEEKVEEAPAEAEAVEETVEAAAEEVIAEEVKAEEAPAEEAPVEEKPEEKEVAPKEEAKAEEKPKKAPAKKAAAKKDDSEKAEEKSKKAAPKKTAAKKDDAKDAEEKPAAKKKSDEKKDEDK